MDWLLGDYWPWWFSASVFALVTVGIWLIEGRLLGVSGSYAMALQPTPEGDSKLIELQQSDPSAVEDALLRATLEEFGPEAVEEFDKAMAQDEREASAAPAASLRTPLPRSAHVAFLLMLVAGGVIGAALTGGWNLRADLGALHSLLLGEGALSLAALAIGGIFVGFGTRMAGGCTSGHGLSGCSRLQPGSLAATASFFGAAVATSFLLEVIAK